MKYFRVARRLNDGRAMLNIGCGTRAHPDWENVDFSPYARLARRKWLARILRGVGLLSRERSRNVLGVPSTIRCWDVRKGIPFDENAFDVVYHSHFLTHIDRERAPYVLKECWRVLKRGGTIRVVVPDLEGIVRRYNDVIAAYERGDEEASRRHEEAVDELFELMVRARGVGTSQQRPLVRIIERLVRGNTRDMGEARRWHYDQYSLGALLRSVGFHDVQSVDARTSRIDGWSAFRLDTNGDGSVYKPGSLSMEGAK